MKKLWDAITGIITLAESIQRIEKKLDEISERLQKLEDRFYEHVTDHSIHVQLHG